MTFSSFLAGPPFSCVPGQGLMVSADGRLPLHPAKPRRGPPAGAENTNPIYPMARTFPYPREIATEAELMALTREKEEAQ